MSQPTPPDRSSPPGNFIRDFVVQVVFSDPAITACVSDPEEANTRSVRAFEKAGFDVQRAVLLRGERSPRRIVRLPRT